MPSIFDNVTGFIGQEYDATTGYVKKEYNAGIDYTEKQYNDLKIAVKQWASNVVRLMNLKVPPQMASEKNALLSKARYIKAACEKIFGKLDNLNQLGFIPIIVGVTLVAIVGAHTLIKHWEIDAKALEMRVNVFNAAIAKGASVKDATSVADSVTDDKGLLSSLNKLTGSGKDISETVKKYAPLIGIAVIAWVFRNQIASTFRDKK